MIVFDKLLLTVKQSVGIAAQIWHWANNITWTSTINGGLKAIVSRTAQFQRKLRPALLYRHNTKTGVILMRQETAFIRMCVCVCVCV